MLRSLHSRSSVKSGSQCEVARLYHGTNRGSLSCACSVSLSLKTRARRSECPCPLFMTHAIASPCLFHTREHRHSWDWNPYTPICTMLSYRPHLRHRACTQRLAYPRLVPLASPVLHPLRVRHRRHLRASSRPAKCVSRSCRLPHWNLIHLERDGRLEDSKTRRWYILHAT